MLKIQSQNCSFNLNTYSKYNYIEATKKFLSMIRKPSSELLKNSLACVIKTSQRM